MNMLELLAGVVVEEGKIGTALAMGGQRLFNRRSDTLQRLLGNCPESEKCRRVKILLETEIKYKENMLSTIAEYPFYSIRGTCGKKCCLDACERIDFPCCKNKVIGYTGNVIYSEPESVELLGSLMGWSFLCEDLDIVLILHDSYPVSMDNFTFATGYQLRNGMIRVLNETDAKALYQEYNERYPFDTSEAERLLRYLHRK